MRDGRHDARGEVVTGVRKSRSRQATDTSTCSEYDEGKPSLWKERPLEDE